MAGRCGPGWRTSEEREHGVVVLVHEPVDGHEHEEAPHEHEHPRVELLLFARRAVVVVAGEVGVVLVLKQPAAGRGARITPHRRSSRALGRGPPFGVIVILAGSDSSGSTIAVRIPKG